MDFSDNALAQQALEVMRETNDSLFLTWKAWTWKSTVLKEFFAKSNGKQCIKLAPTGVAALNIGWMTIHKFFGFGIDTTPEKIEEGEFYMKWVYRKMLAEADTLVIDEISMVRADLFEMIDAICKVVLWSDEPFGGKQLVLIWDCFQLPPVVKEQELELFRTRYKSPFFFDSLSFQQLGVMTIELQHIYRQTDKEFVRVLNAIRLGIQEERMIDYLNNATIDSFEELPTNTIVVSTTRKIANYLNHKLLGELNEKTIENKATVKWNFPQTMFPNDALLSFKVGAQVMMIKNHKDGLYHNGSIGKIHEMSVDEEGNEIVVVSIDDSLVDVTKEQREVFEPLLNKQTNTIEYESKWIFTQYPFRLWRAVTIHKSQWLTFDTVCVDIGSGSFAQGQTYVALSRVTSYNGLYLNRTLSTNDIQCDVRVLAFMGKTTVPQKIDRLFDAIDNTSTISFMYISPDANEWFEGVSVESVEQQERKEVKFRVLTGVVWGEKKQWSIRRMFEIQ